MKPVVYVLSALVLYAGSATAQQIVPEPITGARVIVVADTGDPATLPSLGQRDTALSQSVPVCNQAQPATATTPLVNPSTVVVDDPFNGGRTCRLAIPLGLTEGSYRAVVQFLTNAASCTHPTTGQTISPCISDRSAVGIPPFSIADIRQAPTVPTGVRVIP